MTPPRIVHVLRAPVVGGSELETAAIVAEIEGFQHEVIYPAEFAAFTPCARARFPAHAAPRPSPDVEGDLHRRPPALVHVQFPFLIDRTAPHHPTVLVFKGLHDGPPCPTVFTVHAAVNVPVLPRLHYVFHTAALRARFPEIEDARATILPSLVAPPPATRVAPAPRAPNRIRILAVARDEDAKFHPRLREICGAVLAARPDVEFRFVGAAPSRQPAPSSRVSIVPCPAPDLEAEYAAADVFWHFPDPGLEETWCRTVTEAADRGLPCVVAAHGAMATQIRDGVEGRVVADVDACVAALLGLAGDAAFRRRAGLAARDRAGRFRAEARRGFAALYRRLIAPVARAEESPP